MGSCVFSRFIRAVERKISIFFAVSETLLIHSITENGELETFNPRLLKIRRNEKESFAVINCERKIRKISLELAFVSLLVLL